jgi:phosphoserine phosphatase
MPHVVTLIAAPHTNIPLPNIADDLRAMLRGEEPAWLAAHACDIAFCPENKSALQQARTATDEIRSTYPVDAVIQRAEGRRKRLLMADMDSTIIGQECLDEIAVKAGIGEKIAAITERAMRGELDFESALRERVGLLKSFPEALLQHVLDTQISLNPGAKVLTATMHAHGARAVLVSGGFTFFTEAVARKAGFDANYGNNFIIEEGMIVGVAEPILGQNAKLSTTRKEVAVQGIRSEDVIAIGDGANDLAMLKEAGLGVAFHAKPRVAAEATARIDHNDLSALLFVQGYAEGEFVV